MTTGKNVTYESCDVLIYVKNRSIFRPCGSVWGVWVSHWVKVGAGTVGFVWQMTLRPWRCVGKAPRFSIHTTHFLPSEAATRVSHDATETCTSEFNINSFQFQPTKFLHYWPLPSYGHVTPYLLILFICFSYSHWRT